jgi:C4-dicarboxylate transporter DctQ subunit
VLAKIIDRLEEGSIAFLLAAMTVLTFVQVILRYGFSMAVQWSLEATVYLFAWLILIGISYGVKTGSHIGVDALVNILPAIGKRVAGIVAGVLCIVYAGFMTAGSWSYFETVYEIGVTGEDIPIQRWILIAILPIGFALLAFRLIQATWRIVRGDATGLKLADEAADSLRQFQQKSGPSA